VDQRCFELLEAQIENPFLAAFGKPGTFTRIVQNRVGSGDRTTIFLVGLPDGTATIVGQTLLMSVLQSARRISITH
jgi:hypothetical protein